ncbi:class I SAM-dependent methyltransferase [Nocardia huaxiensis]|uniref:Class I SAM-dependent methyltransferase n=1 Tax=Nocardia huaxiensis TaxID=2755382 RepID=A0A7D6VEL6_9NOCA|nr:class I SAM-dependent methyltransferase [Nocardia huaxiensis]QLY33571.1 class I SAM-dependent methyltransferase [Nocardia huaxiensis]
MTTAREDARDRTLDYEAVYRGEGPFGGNPPWEIGDPQPAFVAEEAAGHIRGDVLDAGCGTGDNALYLVGRGYAVTGVDRSTTAIEIARRKTAERNLQATFAVADALVLDGYDDSFDTVVDSGLAHRFGHPELVRYAAALHRVCRPGAVVIVHAISDRVRELFDNDLAGILRDMRAQNGGNGFDWTTMPKMSAELLRGGFAAGWELEALETSTIRTAFPFTPEPFDIPAWIGRFRRA